MTKQIQNPTASSSPNAEPSRLHKASGVELCNALAFPDATTFAELFSEAAKFGKESRKFRVNPTCFLNVTSYLTRSALGNYRGYDVTPNQMVLDYLGRSMILVEHDSIFFEIVDHEGGWSLVLAKYNQILGSKWLAYVRTDSIPDCHAEEKKPAEVESKSETPGKYSRADYMEKRCTHAQFYGQFVTPAILRLVGDTIGRAAIRKSTDPHFNDIPLSCWDMLDQYEIFRGSLNAALKQAGDHLSLSSVVCVAKEAARQIKEGK